MAKVSHEELSHFLTCQQGQDDIRGVFLARLSHQVLITYYNLGNGGNLEFVRTFSFSAEPGKRSGKLLRVHTVDAYEAARNNSHTPDSTYDGIVIDLDVNVVDNDPVCGDPGWQTYWKSDLNEDCDVNILDFSLLASPWLICSHPLVPGCSQP